MAAMGRPREFDRDAALEAAMFLFWRKGFATTSMNDLCGAMGVGSPSLYAAFGSKEALYLEAVEYYVRTQGPPVWEKLAEEVKFTKIGQKKMKVIGVVGSGQMGAGIAQVAAQSGYQVIVEDIISAALEKASIALEVLYKGLGDSKYRPAPLLRQYVDAGWLGKKTKRGFYRYD